MDGVLLWLARARMRRRLMVILGLVGPLVWMLGAASDAHVSAPISRVVWEPLSRQSPGQSSGPGSALVSEQSLIRTHTRWQWPLRPASVIRPFLAPPTPYAAGHRGIDLAAEPGTTITAPAGATVSFAGVVVDRPVLTLDHGGGVLSSYEPLTATAGLAVGSTVRTGDVIGTVATGGHCHGGCLHIGVRIDNAYVSPLLFFDRVPPAVLLPLHPAGAFGGAGIILPGRPVTRSGARMRDAVALLESFRRDVGVDLGRPETRVSQQFLHRTQVGPTVEEVGCGCMP